MAFADDRGRQSQIGRAVRVAQLNLAESARQEDVGGGDSNGVAGTREAVSNVRSIIEGQVAAVFQTVASLAGNAEVNVIQGFKSVVGAAVASGRSAALTRRLRP